MGVLLVEITEEFVKTMLSRQSAGGHSPVPQPPFADQRGMVSRLLQHFRDCRILGTQRLGNGIGRPRIAADSRVTVMLARHQDAA